MRAHVVLAALLLGGCVSKSKYADLETAYSALETKATAAEAAAEACRTQSSDDQAKLDKVQAFFKKRLDRAEELRDALKPLVTQGVLEVRMVNGQVTLGLASDVLFASGSATLSAQGRDYLTKVAAALAKRTEAGVRIEGHSDNLPISSKAFPSNWHLAAARSIAVVEVMVAAGLPADRVYAASFGDTRPIASNDDDDGRAQNRRIEVVLDNDLSSLPGFQLLAFKAESVLGVLKRNRKQSRTCMQAAAKNNVTIDGAVTLSITLADGKATGVTVTEDTTGQPKFSQCVADVVKGLDFTGVADGTHVQAMEFHEK
jgi:chemotaxis protein MotB